MKIFPVVRKRLHDLDMKSDIPPVMFMLELYGVNNMEVASLIGRTPQMVTYYRNGTTQLPDDIEDKLYEALKFCTEIKIETDSRLIAALRHQAKQVLGARK